MYEAPASLSLLDRLRAQSAAARIADEAARRPAEDALREIGGRLQSASRWLDEAQGHLAAIRPVVAHRFAVGPGIVIATPRYCDGFVSARRAMFAGVEVVAHVALSYRLAAASPIRVTMPTGAAAALAQHLRGAHVDFCCDADGPGARGARNRVFTITPAVAASVRFVPDYRRRIVAATLVNVDRLEAVALEFPPEDIGEPALEDLVRLILGESNAFLRRAPLAGVGAGRAAFDTGEPRR